MNNNLKAIRILYRNWKGNLKWREITPITMVYMKSEYYDEPQWFIEAFDQEKAKVRHFAVKNILSFNNEELRHGS